MTQMLSPIGAKIIALAIVTFAASALFASTAAQPNEKGNQGRGRGQAEKPDKADKSDRDHGRQKNGSGKFSSGDRAAVREYFAKADSCPPGLAKKGNGCMPPGQAKKAWVIGSALPSTVIIESVPAELVVHLSVPPVGHRYVRVAGDVLMMAEGARMIVDAVVDLGR